MPSDPCTDPFAEPIWGKIDAVSPDRVEWIPPGLLTPAYRRLTVIDGDDASPVTQATSPDARCELGRNGVPTFAEYHEGETHRTTVKMRLGEGFPVDVVAWQVVLQQKQRQPYVNPCGNVPMVSVQIWGGQIRLCLADPLAISNPTIWACPAIVGKKFKLRIDGYYSADDDGWIQLTVGRYLQKWQSPVVHGPNLLRACTDGNGYLKGDPIPNHLRIGVYHAPSIVSPLGATSIDLFSAEVS